MNTTCHACGKVTVPTLSVHTRVRREVARAADAAEGDAAASDAAETEVLEPLATTPTEVQTAETTVPYLNPLFLRKELESILAQEGDGALAAAEFIEQHPIIYWNLVWLMERIDVSTHLPGLSVPKEVSWGLVIWGNDECFSIWLVINRASLNPKP